MGLSCISKWSQSSYNLVCSTRKILFLSHFGGQPLPYVSTDAYIHIFIHELITYSISHASLSSSGTLKDHLADLFQLLNTSSFRIWHVSKSRPARILHNLDLTLEGELSWYVWVHITFWEIHCTCTSNLVGLVFNYVGCRGGIHWK